MLKITALSLEYCNHRLPGLVTRALVTNIVSENLYAGIQPLQTAWTIHVATSFVVALFSTRRGTIGFKDLEHCVDPHFSRDDMRIIIGVLGNLQCSSSGELNLFDGLTCSDGLSEDFG